MFIFVFKNQNVLNKLTVVEAYDAEVVIFFCLGFDRTSWFRWTTWREGSEGKNALKCSLKHYIVFQMTREYHKVIFPIIFSIILVLGI